MNYPQTYTPTTNAMDQARSALSVAQATPANAFSGYQPQSSYRQDNAFAGMNMGMSDGNYGSQAFGQPQQAGFMNPGQGDGGMFDNFGLDQLGAGVGIAQNLYGMYNAHKGMGLAEDQLGMQKQAFADNKANRDRFVGDTAAAFA